jgi:predicted nucleic acid-binding protein
VRFFDASAIVKRYVREPESGRVRRLLRRRDVAICRLSEVEVVSGFARLTREGAISVAQRDRVTARFVTDLAAWTVVEIHPDVTRTARRLLLQHPVRAGDALQLGAALVLQETLGQPLDEFVAYDERLIEAARAEHLTIPGSRRRGS